MQAIKEKISDIRGVRRVKYDARQEQAELARAQANEIAHEARLIREANAAMGLQIEDVVHHQSKLAGDHMNPTGYGGDGLNIRHVADHGHSGERSSYGGATTNYSGGTYSGSGSRSERNMPVNHNKYL